VTYYSFYGSVAKTLLMGFTEINRNLGVYVMPVDSFKWKHYAGEMILLNVRWYLKYALSGSVAKNLAILQNQWKTSQIGYLYAISRSIIIQKAIVIA
jgi:hypothetical protein